MNIIINCPEGRSLGRGLICLVFFATTAFATTALVSWPSLVLAQDAELEEIVVTGIRGSMRRSLDIKRGASQIIDAVSAEDVGKFPDTNVAEALQRITGVAIDRNGGEGQFITVRGLGPEFNTVLVNGRTMATDNDGREFSFDVLSANIIQSAQVYKTALPQVQSGGIGSVVNIATARPFDYDGNRFSISAAGIYDDLREDVTPDVTAFASWVNNDKTFGALIAGSYSERNTQLEEAAVGGYILSGDNLLVDGTANSVGLTPADTFTNSGARVPRQYTLQRLRQDRERITINGSVQASLSDNLSLTIDGLYSTLDIVEDGQVASFFFTPPFLDVNVDGNDTVVGFNRPGLDFIANNPALGIGSASQNDNVIRGRDRDVTVYQFGGNLEWNVTEKFDLVADISISDADRNDDGRFVVVGSLAQTAPRFDIIPGNEIPSISNLTSLDDPSLQRAHFISIEDDTTTDEIVETRLDANWDIDAGPLARVSFGAFYTDREKSFEDKRSAPRCAFCGYTFPVDPSLLTLTQLDGFLSGTSGTGGLPTDGFNFDVGQYFDFLNANLASAGDPAAVQAALDAGISGPFGIYTPVLRPTQGFNVEETVVAFHFNSEWEGDFGGSLPWSANIGFRVASTDTTSSGIDAPIVSFSESPGDTQLIVNRGPSQNISIENDYFNFLPSLNLKLDVRDNVSLRFGWSETITRPTLTALGVASSFGGRSFSPTSSGGNPSLEAFESTNYDISAEWYYSDVGFVGAAFFYKEFDQFIESQTLLIPNQITLNTGDVVTVDFEDTRNRNGEMGSIVGLELAVQHTFDNLPGIWSGLGIAGNYTYVDSDIQRSEGSGAADCDYNGLSPHSFNANGFFESNKVQMRLAYNYRDEFLVQCFSAQSQPRNRESFGQIDFSAAYAINDQVQVFIEGINITDETSRDFSIFSNRFLRLEQTGRRFIVGGRVTF